MLAVAAVGVAGFFIHKKLKCRPKTITDDDIGAPDPQDGGVQGAGLAERNLTERIIVESDGYPAGTMVLEVQRTPRSRAWGRRKEDVRRVLRSDCRQEIVETISFKRASLLSKRYIGYRICADLIRSKGIHRFSKPRYRPAWVGVKCALGVVFSRISAWVKHGVAYARANRTLPVVLLQYIALVQRQRMIHGGGTGVRKQKERPWSRKLVKGEKSIEVRTYELPKEYIGAI
eukprot:1182716-Prorocentrum_minimum.AAC.9